MTRHTLRRAAALAILTLLASLATTTSVSAQSKTQGSPLAAAANYAYGCETAWLPPFPPSMEASPIPSGASTCTIFQSGTTTDDMHLVPATGTIVSARVKSGANPAPLQITTMRRFFKPNAMGQMQYTCCQGISQTATFQPTPNAITEVPVNLLVSTQQPENGQTGWWDIVAVSAEGPGSLPIADLGPNPALASPGMPTTFWYYPKVAPSASNQNEWSASNFEVLMQYDWCPSTTGTTAAAAAACPAAPPRSEPPRVEPPRAETPRIEPPRAEQPSVAPQPRARARPAPAGVANRQLALSARGAVEVRVACTGASRCRGTVRLRTRGRRPALLASSPFAVNAGRTKAIRLALSRRSRRRLAGRRTEVRAEIDLGRAGRVAKNLVLVRQGG